MLQVKPRVSDEHADRIRRRIAHVARLLDGAFEIPGTGVRFGLDPILGLAPGVGDVLSAAASVYIIYEARRLGASRRVLWLMGLNVLIDVLIGLVPVAGDAADVAYKANQRNLKLLGIDPRSGADMRTERKPARSVVDERAGDSESDSRQAVSITA
jgi:hypothetical protein